MAQRSFHTDINSIKMAFSSSIYKFSSQWRIVIFYGLLSIPCAGRLLYFVTAESQVADKGLKVRFTEKLTAQEQFM